MAEGNTTHAIEAPGVGLAIAIPSGDLLANNLISFIVDTAGVYTIKLRRDAAPIAGIYLVAGFQYVAELRQITAGPAGATAYGTSR